MLRTFLERSKTTRPKKDFLYFPTGKKKKEKRKKRNEISSLISPRSLGVYRPTNNHCSIVFKWHATPKFETNRNERRIFPSRSPVGEHRESDIHPSENRLKAWMTVARCVAVARFAPWLIVNVHTARQWLAKRETPAWNAPAPVKYHRGRGGGGTRARYVFQWFVFRSIVRSVFTHRPFRTIARARASLISSNGPFTF